MPITIATTKMDEYASVEWLINEVMNSETVGLTEVRDLLEPMKGFSDEGLTNSERAGNYVRVFHFAEFTDLLAGAAPVRLHPVKLATHQPQRPAQTKFAVYYRDVLCFIRNAHVYADSAEDAARIIMEDGYGFADGQTLYPRKIERVEPVPATPF